MSKKRILLIDDEPGFTRLLKLNLEETGAYEVRQENMGADGLATAREFKPDLILLDVIMPDMNGGDIALQIEADRKLKNIPIVFLTGSAPKKRHYIIGSRPFLVKPASVEQVISCIEEHLKRIPEPPTSSDPSGLRHLAIPILAIILVGAGIFGYKLYTRTQQSFQETFKELQKTRKELSSLRSAATRAIPKEEKQFAHEEKKATEKNDSLQRMKAMEALLQKTLKDIQEGKASEETQGSLSGSLLTELAPSVVKIYCLANSSSDDIQTGSGFLYRAKPSSSEYPPYYVQTNIHVVKKTDGSMSKCRIVLYPNYANGSEYLLFKSEGYRFYRKDIDVAILEPEILKDNVRVPAGTLIDLATYARDQAETQVCDPVNIGDRLSILGYPGIGGETLTVTDGIISGFELIGGTRYLKTSAKIDHGNSGGIAVKDSGCLIGIPTFVRRSRVESIGRILDLEQLSNVTLK